MATHAQPAAPRWNDPQETSINVWWTAPPGVTKQVLEVREFPKPWQEARKIELDGASTSKNVEGLFPTSTFEFRLTFVYADGTVAGPGPATSADTLAAGCTPKSENKKKNCVIQ